MQCNAIHREITAWLASASFRRLSRQVHNKNRTNEPTMQQFVYAKHIEIILKLETCQRRTMSKQNIESQNRIIQPFVSPLFWPK